jgi:hypothetical protein
MRLRGQAPDTDRELLLDAASGVRMLRTGL